MMSIKPSSTWRPASLTSVTPSYRRTVTYIASPYLLSYAPPVALKRLLLQVVVKLVQQLPQLGLRRHTAKKSFLNLNKRSKKSPTSLSVRLLVPPSYLLPGRPCSCSLVRACHFAPYIPVRLEPATSEPVALDRTLALSHTVANWRSFARSLEGASFTSSFASATICSVLTLISSAGVIPGATSFAAFSISLYLLLPVVGRDFSAPPICSTNLIPAQGGCT